MDDLGGTLVLLWLARNMPVDDELEEANSPLPWPAFEGWVQAAVPDADVDVALGGVVAVVDEDEDDDDDVDEEEAVALAPGPPVAPVLLGDDAVQRLLLYVDLLGLRAELVHALPRLVRDIVQGLFRVI